MIKKHIKLHENMLKTENRHILHSHLCHFYNSIRLFTSFVHDNHKNRPRTPIVFKKGKEKQKNSND